MKVIGWQQKKVIKGREFGLTQEEETTDIYIFENPEIVKYPTGFIGVHPVDNNYKYYRFINGYKTPLVDYKDIQLFDKDSITLIGGGLAGVRIHEDCLIELGKINLEDLSK